VILAKDRGAGGIVIGHYGVQVGCRHQAIVRVVRPHAGRGLSQPRLADTAQRLAGSNDTHAERTRGEGRDASVCAGKVSTVHAADAVHSVEAAKKKPARAARNTGAGKTKSASQGASKVAAIAIRSAGCCVQGSSPGCG